MRLEVKKRSTKRHGSAESGSVLVEFAYTVLFMTALSFAIVDFGGWILEHMRASRIAYEGVRYAAIVPNLSDGDRVPLPLEVAERVGRIVNKHPQIQAYQSTFSKGLEDNNETEGVGEWVEIQISIPYEFRFFPFYATSVNARARSAYLYSTRDS